MADKEDILNSIPFNNLCIHKAKKTPYSDYAKFHLRMQGIQVFNIERKELVTKGELWLRYSKRKTQLKQVINCTHPMYNFFTSEQWINLTRFLRNESTLTSDITGP